MFINDTNSHCLWPLFSLYNRCALRPGTQYTSTKEHMTYELTAKDIHVVQRRRDLVLMIFSPKKKVDHLVNTFAANSKQDSYHIVVECHGSSYLHPYMVRVRKGKCVGRRHQRWPVHGNLPSHTGYPRNRQRPTHRTIRWAVFQAPAVHSP